MRKSLINLFIYLSSLHVFSQAPVVQWENGYGGSVREVGKNIIQLPNGQFAICGISSSFDHDVTNNHSIGDDLWYLNINDVGNLISQKCYGGTGVDQGKSVNYKNNQLEVFGTSSSEDFDLTGVHSSTFGADLWFLKLDTLLNITFQKTFGSISTDEATTLLTNDNESYIFLGRVAMAGNDVDTTYGDYDLWVCKTDTNLNIIWQKSLGSSWNDVGGDIVKSTDGGYLVIGGIQAYDGNVTCSPSSGTLWLVKLDSIGNIMWQKCFSSTYGVKVVSTSDGGFVVAAMTYDNTIPGYSDLRDYLLFKIDSLGNRLWAHCYGGSMFDDPADLIQCSDGGFLIAGTSDSYDFYSSSSHGAKDALLIKVDSAGNFQWSQCYGGYGDDICNSVVETTDGGFAITGSTTSWVGLPNYGFTDLWVLKMNYSGAGIKAPENSIEQFYVYSTKEGIEINVYAKKNQIALISVYDISGRLLISDHVQINFGKSKLNFDFENARGVFLIEVINAEGRIVQKVIK